MIGSIRNNRNKTAAPVSQWIEIKCFIVKTEDRMWPDPGGGEADVGIVAAWSRWRALITRNATVKHKPAPTPNYKKKRQRQIS